MTTCHAIGLHL